MNISVVYRCNNCGLTFRKDTSIELFSKNLEEQLKLSEKDNIIVDTLTGATYPLKTLHQCRDNEYGIGTFTKLEVT